MANASYDEFGTVPFIAIKKGHVSLESGSDVNAIHLEKTDSSFDEIKISVGNGIETPKLSREAVGTSLTDAILVCEIETSNSSEFIWIEGNGTIEDSKISVSTTKTGTKTPVTETTASDAAKQIANTKTGETAVDTGVTAETAQTTSALKGLGTEADPFIVYDYETMQKISGFYENGFYYFKVKEGITEIDCTGWTPVYLNGSFDGNGVKFLNVTAVLFYNVGYKLEKKTIVLKDFEATMNITNNGEYGTGSMIKNLFNSGTTTFKNIKVHGYLEGYWNIGSFYSYGTANYNNVGSDYTVEFINSTSDATLVCSTGNTCGGMLGHSYEGTGHSFTMKIDNASGFTGRIFTTTGKGGKYFAMTSDYNNTNNHFYFNGTENTFNNGSTSNSYANCNTITSVTPTKAADGYYIAKTAGASKITVSITGQFTATDASGNNIPNMNGITMSLTLDTITSPTESQKVMSSITSVELINSTGTTAVVNGVLKVYTGSSTNYTYGPARLQVNQYATNGELLSCGTLNIASKTASDTSWTII